MWFQNWKVLKDSIFDFNLKEALNYILSSPQMKTLA